MKTPEGSRHTPSLLGKEEIREEIFRLAHQETGISSFKPTGVLRGIFEVMAILVNRIYSTFLSPMMRNIDRHHSTGFWLDLHGNNLGLGRELPLRARGTFTGEAYSAGQVKKGTWIRVEGTDLRFRVTEDVPFTRGEFPIPVEAEKSGDEYNIVPPAPLIMTTVTRGIEEIRFDKEWITEPGQDKESDSQYRNRINNRWDVQGDGNSPARYELVARSVKGIVDARVVRAPRGFGSMDLYILGAAGMPSQKQIAQVEEALEEYQMICRSWRVLPPEREEVTIKIIFSGSYSKEQVKVRTREWINSLGIGNPLQVRRLYSEPWTGWEFDRFEVVTPTRDTVISPYAIFDPQIEVEKSV